MSRVSNPRSILTIDEDEKLSTTTYTRSRHGSSVSGSSSSPKSPQSEVSFTTTDSSKALLDKTNTPAGGGFLSQANVARLNDDGGNVDDGWSLLATLMDQQPGFEAFPRYRELNIKNLLYYQVELAAIRKTLKEQENYDRTQRAGPEGDYSKYADKMIREGKCANPNQFDSKGEQWKQVLKLRTCLREYNEALLRYAQISDLPEPNSRNMDELVKWIVKPGKGNFGIGGTGSQEWGELYELPRDDPTLVELLERLGHGLLAVLMFWKKKAPPTRSDLVAPRRHRKVDSLARWIVYDAAPWTAFFWKGVTRPIVTARERRKAGLGDLETSVSSASKAVVPPVKQERKSSKQQAEEETPQDPRLAHITLVSERVVNKFTSFVATIVACLLPTGAIAVLTTAHTNVHRLLWIGGFTMLFAMGLTAFTSEISRVQVFMAAAAFSAVLVVFVQNQ